MDDLIPKLQRDYPDLSFKPSHSACWSPHKNEVSYTADPDFGQAGLLHELAHALLGHTHYATDIDLLHKEVAAWQRACELADTYGIAIDDDHIQDCLDTYRDWLHKRSTCPNCNTNGLQLHTGRYSCLNCMQTWRVSSARLKRPYRRLQRL